jgi:hypothetical protein
MRSNYNSSFAADILCFLLVDVQSVSLSHPNASGRTFVLYEVLAMHTELLGN